MSYRQICALIGSVLLAAGATGVAQPPGEKLWEFATGAGIEQTAAIAPDGTIFVACGGVMSGVNKLYALNPDGSKKWEVRMANPYSTAPAIDTRRTWS